MFSLFREALSTNYILFCFKITSIDIHPLGFPIKKNSFNLYLALERYLIRIPAMQNSYDILNDVRPPSFEEVTQSIGNIDVNNEIITNEHLTINKCW